MHKRSGTFLEASTWGTTTTSTNSRTSSSWQMSLRPFKRPACGSIAWTLRIITQAQAFRRTRCSRKQAWNSDCSRIMTSISLLRRGCGAEFPRYTRVKNPQVEGYDTSKPKTRILYLDANNLYRWAMSQPLPMGGFEWVQDRVWLKNSHSRPSGRQFRGLYSRGGPRIPRGAARGAQRLPVGAGAHGGLERECMSEY